MAMQAIFDKLRTKQLEYSSIMVTYKSNDGTWRGFVVPFDVTFEADSKDEVVHALRSMVDAYVDGLHEYSSPDHLSSIPLSHPEDRKKWDKICMQVINKLANKMSKIDAPDYYAEAQLPA